MRITEPPHRLAETVQRLWAQIRCQRGLERGPRIGPPPHSQGGQAGIHETLDGHAAIMEPRQRHR
jgi:hypothetical protein